MNVHGFANACKSVIAVFTCGRVLHKVASASKRFNQKMAPGLTFMAQHFLELGCQSKPLQVVVLWQEAMQSFRVSILSMRNASRSPALHGNIQNSLLHSAKSLKI